VVVTGDAVSDMECHATALLCFLWHCWSVRSPAILTSSLIQTMDVPDEATTCAVLWTRTTSPRALRWL